MPRTSKTRDREATAAMILAAAKTVLAAEGFQGFGVNAIARAAGCDKQLIYRYFEGVDGLIDAIGADLANWWADALAPAAALPPAKTYAELMERLALGALDALRKDALVQKIAAWEIAEPSPQVARLNAARSKGMVQWMMSQRGQLTPPPGVDAPAANAILMAAIQHLVLASTAAGHFSGAPLKTGKDWDRIRDALRKVIAALYSG